MGKSDLQDCTKTMISSVKIKTTNEQIDRQGDYMEKISFGIHKKSLTMLTFEQ